MRPSELGLAHSFPTLRSQNSDVFTLLLDGTILPNVTRALVLAYLSHYPLATVLPWLPVHMRIRTAALALTLSELFAA